MPNKVITIAQQKGGAGKTTLAVHLATTLRQRGFRVAMVDIDPQGSTKEWHNIREKRYGEGYTGLSFSAVSGWRVGSEIARLRKNHDFIVIDSPPHTETEARTAIRNADLILIPVQPSPTDLWATKATVDIAKAEKIPYRIVLNRVQFQTKLAPVIAAELPQLARTTIGNRVLFAAALMEGRSATEVEPSSTAAKEIKALAEEVLSLFPDFAEEETEDTAAAAPANTKSAKSTRNAERVSEMA